MAIPEHDNFPLKYVKSFTTTCQFYPFSHGNSGMFTGNRFSSEWIRSFIPPCLEERSFARLVPELTSGVYWCSSFIAIRVNIRCIKRIKVYYSAYVQWSQQWQQICCLHLCLDLAGLRLTSSNRKIYISLSSITHSQVLVNWART